MSNPSIKQITLPTGTTYDIVDQGARELIAGLSGSTQFLGVTTTELEDGVTTNPTITVNGESVTASAGGIATYDSKEFIYNGTVWQEFGDLSGLGDLAFKNSATGSFTPSGTVSQPTFTGSSTTSTGTFTPSGSVTITTEATSTGKNYTPAGTVSQPTFSGSSTTSTGSFTPSGSVTISEESSGTANYTPAGSVSAPEVTVTPATSTVYSITAVGTSPSFTATVSNENLTLGWSAGTLPTKGDAQTVVTGITSATATSPTFTGTGAILSASFSGSSGTVSVTGTPSGTVSQPTFTGTDAKISASFSGSSGSVSVSGTPSGTVSQPTFSGSSGTVSVS